jgi:hypothetical protein
MCPGSPRRRRGGRSATAADPPLGRPDWGLTAGLANYPLVI